MDRRLRLAVDASVAWYDDVFALHGIGARVVDGVWRCDRLPPPLHSAVKTVVPGVPVPVVLDALVGLGGADVAVADSFGDLALGEAGFVPFIDARWIHRPPVPAGPMPDGWSVVRTLDALRRWVAAHGTPGVFVDGVLGHPRFALLARSVDGRTTGGFVAHDARRRAVGLSNAFGVGWAEALAVVAAVRPGRPLVDHTSGADLADALTCGFTAVGPQRVWRRTSAPPP